MMNILIGTSYAVQMMLPGKSDLVDASRYLTRIFRAETL
jgi:hypothetical protein